LNGGGNCFRVSISEIPDGLHLKGNLKPQMARMIADKPKQKAL
jgi:hypothetical protein